MRKLVITYNSKKSGLPRTVVMIEDENKEQELLWSEQYIMDIEIDNQSIRED